MEICTAPPEAQVIVETTTTPVALPSQHSPTKRRKRRSIASQWTRKKFRTDGATKSRPIGERRLQDVDCKCWNRCMHKITSEQRQQLFQEFWNMGSYSKQRWYLASHVLEVGKKTVCRPDSRRKFTREYYFTVGGKKQSVCRQFFVKTLGISEKMITQTLEKRRANGERPAVPKKVERIIDDGSLGSAIAKLNGAELAAAKSLLSLTWPKDMSVVIEPEQVPVSSETNNLQDPSKLGHWLQPVTCKCWHGCSSKITESQRQKIFRQFWSLDGVKQQEYLESRIFEMKKKKTQLRSGKPSRRKYSCEYYLDADGHRFQVCLNYFVKTLDVTINMVRVILKHRRIQENRKEMPLFQMVPNTPSTMPKIVDVFSTAQAVPESLKKLHAVSLDMVAPAAVSNTEDYLDVGDSLEVVLTIGNENLTLNDDISEEEEEVETVPDPFSLAAFPMAAAFFGEEDDKPRGRSARPPRRLEPVDCRCWNQCNMKISEKHRQKIFEHFWQLGSYSLQRQYLLSHVVDKKKRCVRSPKGMASRRQYTCEYYLEVSGSRVQVCQRFFIKTLGISGSLVHLTLRKKRTFGVEMAGIDRRGLWRSMQGEKEAIPHIPHESSKADDTYLPELKPFVLPNFLATPKTEPVVMCTVQKSNGIILQSIANHHLALDSISKNPELEVTVTGSSQQQPSAIVLDVIQKQVPVPRGVVAKDAAPLAVSV